MTPAVQPPTFWQRLVGGFVAVQLLFLLLANGFFLLARVCQREPDGEPSALTNVVETLPRVTQPYAELTGQRQGWSLFAPNVPRLAAFVFVEARKADGKWYRVWSDEQPADTRNYLRPLFTGRLLQYELHVRILALNWGQIKAGDDPRVIDQLSDDEIRFRHTAMKAYLTWQFQRQFPQEPLPEALELWVRATPIYRPGTPADPDAFLDLPLARWRPGVTPPAGCLPIERYDINLGFEPIHPEQFLWVPEKGGS